MFYKISIYSSCILIYFSSYIFIILFFVMNKFWFFYVFLSFRALLLFVIGICFVWFECYFHLILRLSIFFFVDFILMRSLQSTVFPYVSFDFGTFLRGHYRFIVRYWYDFVYWNLQAMLYFDFLNDHLFFFCCLLIFTRRLSWEAEKIKMKPLLH